MRLFQPQAGQLGMGRQTMRCGEQVLQLAHADARLGRDGADGDVFG